MLNLARKRMIKSHDSLLKVPWFSTVPWLKLETKKLRQASDKGRMRASRKCNLQPHLLYLIFCLWDSFLVGLHENGLHQLFAAILPLWNRSENGLTSVILRQTSTSGRNHLGTPRQRWRTPLQNRKEFQVLEVFFNIAWALSYCYNTAAIETSWGLRGQDEVIESEGKQSQEWTDSERLGKVRRKCNEYFKFFTCCVADLTNRNLWMIRYPQAVQEILASEEWASSVKWTWLFPIAACLLPRRSHSPWSARNGPDLGGAPKNGRFHGAFRGGCKTSHCGKPGGDGEGKCIQAARMQQRWCDGVRSADSVGTCAHLYVETLSTFGSSFCLVALKSQYLIESFHKTRWTALARCWVADDSHWTKPFFCIFLCC